MLPVTRIHSLYDQGMDAYDIVEWFDNFFTMEDVLDCILAYTDPHGDYDHPDDDVDESDYDRSEQEDDMEAYY
jgi:hypothetical protein